MPPILPSILPPILLSNPVMETLQMIPWASAGYRGEPCIVSHGDAIAEDLCYDNPTQLQHCDDVHEDQVKVDSKASVDSFSCEDCVHVDAKDLEVERHDTKEYEVDSDNAEVEDFNNAEEYHASIGIRGDPCIVYYGDAPDDEPCCDPSNQPDLDEAEYLWDGEYDFNTYEDKELAVESCYYYDEVEDCVHSDYNAEMDDWDYNAEDCSYY